ncbi:hypothetical protein OV203_39810 [Nannocystis sp. ILAH1]|uniref:hypothetical protein n=1 Tax=unclassified Nannocystis TaxID=2627009 RepID=UPI0022719E7B|nr:MULTISPECIES: hypothetical protein [unclassified Nannocystis]MCY0993351.1 hypothetical protein [Nannocystis sp. ILAH1]MCY1063216.1 hypothetical protein [Nannocystis sp. RBIL2]
MRNPTRPSISLPCAAALAVSGLFALAPADAAAAGKTVRVHVQAPVDFHNPMATRLEGIEQYGQVLFWQDFEIPYDQLEKLISEKLDEMVPNKIGDTIVCTDPCPDVTYSVRIKPTFKFTKKNQPVVTKIGPSGDARVKVELSAQAKVSVHADVHAETWIDSVDVPVDVFVVIGVKASVEVGLWPKIDPKPVSLEFTLDDKNIDLELNGKAVGLGMKWGTIIGLSPVGLLVGGPILGPILAILGDEAADYAEQKVSQIFYDRTEKLFAEATRGLEDMVNDYIEPYVKQVNDIKDKLLNKPIKGPNKTVGQLLGQLGASLELHTVAPDGGFAASALVRMTGAPAGGKIYGSVRMPKKVCEYAKVSGGPLKGATIPLGLVDANQDLQAKVGQACTAVLGADGIGRQVYLGANPRTVLGATAQSLPSWKSSGSLTWKGNLVAEADWYACKFEIGGLPNAAVVELETGGAVAARHVAAKERFFEITAAGKSLVFDAGLSPEPVEGGNGQVIFGGAGKCSAGGGGKGAAPNKLKELKDLLDPAKCPQCGIVRKPGSEHVIEITNGDAFAKTNLGKDLVQKVNAAKLNPSQAAPSVKPGAVKPGMQR